MAIFKQYKIKEEEIERFWFYMTIQEEPEFTAFQGHTEPQFLWKYMVTTGTTHSKKVVNWGGKNKQGSK